MFTAFSYQHHLRGTNFRLNYTTATLVNMVFNLALCHRFLSVPTRNGRLCELLFKGRYINPLFNLLIDCSMCIELITAVSMYPSCVALRVLSFCFLSAFEYNPS